MRMDDLAAEEMYDEEAAPSPQQAGESKDFDANNANEQQTVGEVEAKYPTQVWTEEEIQADFMRAEAIKFDELLGRIDLLLGKDAVDVL